MKNKVPLHIVDDHDHALPHILRGIGSKKIPFSNNLLIHFDSHPDLLLDTELSSSDIFDKENLLEKVSIETWILPLAFAGHLSTIVWVKPSWSNQIDEGIYKFFIGEDKDNKIKVSCDILYFISAVNYCPSVNMINKKEITFYVISVDQSFESIQICSTKILDIIEKQNGNYILDIDLDYFSTLNPFVLMYKEANMYEFLKTTYRFPENELFSVPPEEAQQKRKQQLEIFENIFNILSKKQCANKEIGDVNTLCSSVENEHARNALIDLIKKLHKHYDKDVDWLCVHDAGTTVDDESRPLPHYPATIDEIHCNIKSFGEIINKIPKPLIITMARSTSDNYCPLEDVEMIQGNVVKILTDSYELQMNCHYMDIDD